jgi:hypothetical protein
MRQSLVLFFVLTASWMLSASEPFGMALQVNGQVLVTRDILEFEAQVEETFMWDDEIETGEDGSLILVFDSSFLSIGPNTLMHFEKRKGDKQEDLMVMVLEKGSFRSKILNLGSRQFFEVESEAGSLRVHGTDFVTSFNPDSGAGFGVSVLQGRVEITPPKSDAGTASSSSVSAELPSVSMMLTQNKRGGFSGGEQKPVEQISFAQVDAIKEALPVPGDDSGSIVMEDLGIQNVSVENLVEIAKEVQKDLPAETPFEVIQQVIPLRIEFEIVDS